MDMERPSHNQPDRLGPRSVPAVIAVLGVMSAAVYLINFRIRELIPAFSDLSDIQLYVVLFLFLSVLYLGSVVLVLKTTPNKTTSWGLILMIVLSAVFFRISLVPSEPTVLSRDMYRFFGTGGSRPRESTPTDIHRRPRS